VQSNIDCPKFEELIVNPPFIADIFGDEIIFVPNEFPTASVPLYKKDTLPLYGSFLNKGILRCKPYVASILECS
jgi:hypothetical protein